MPKPDRIMEIASAFYESCILFAASDLGVFAKLAELGSGDLHTAASALQINERGARLLLDGCVAVGLLEKKSNLYSNTPESAVFLVPGSPGDLSGAIRYNRDVYAAWGRLAQLAKSGKPVEKPEIHLGEDPERTRVFVMSMHYRALAIGKALLGELKTHGVKTILDVGGGPGTYSVLIAQANPDITCTVLDLPGVVEVAKELILAQGLQDRVKTLAGDYRHTKFPQGNDAVNFFGVLHQEPPQSILSLLRKAHDSLNPGGVVNIMDMMTDDTHTKPKFSALFGINMALTAEHGWVFSDKELTGWLEEAGFIDYTVRPLPPPMPHWFATARKKGGNQ